MGKIYLSFLNENDQIMNWLGNLRYRYFVLGGFFLDNLNLRIFECEDHPAKDHALKALMWEEEFFDSLSYWFWAKNFIMHQKPWCWKKNSLVVWVIGLEQRLFKHNALKMEVSYASCYITLLILLASLEIPLSFFPKKIQNQVWCTWSCFVQSEIDNKLASEHIMKV